MHKHKENSLKKLKSQLLSDMLLRRGSRGNNPTSLAAVLDPIPLVSRTKLHITPFQPLRLYFYNSSIVSSSVGP